MKIDRNVLIQFGFMVVIWLSIIVAGSFLVPDIPGVPRFFISVFTSVFAYLTATRLGGRLYFLIVMRG